ncbi:MAG: DUF1304 domain-containing protein [Betaproteobacteria bacterium HGW-Betaproteobacteria-16]|nr:MAG: DUF1304 domain-containing protein [Betaproteobacteria bacterium HGW-Betaproteobacteria-16]
MKKISLALSLMVCAIHAYILAIEMFFWNKPLGMKTFNLAPEFANATVVMAANQGLYNGFLAAGILWAVMFKHRQSLAFVLACVAVAGMYGAYTSTAKALFVQTVPAVLALVALYLSSRSATGSARTGLAAR